MKAAIYARQSIEHREGIDRQVERCKRQIEEYSERGWEHAETYEDSNVSAASARGSNTAWHRMLRDHEEGKFDVIVAVDLDRLLRSITDLITLQERGIRVRTVDGEIDLTTSDGRFRATMLAAVAHFEVQRKSERQRRANESKISRGLPTPGRRRFGYLPADKSIGRSINTVSNEQEAAIVREIFECFADGEAIYTIAKRLNAEGKTPTTGKGIWRPLRVRETIQNKCYAGFIKTQDDYIASPEVEPIVSLELWQSANNILADPSRTTNPGGPRKHWLSGLGHCAMCGAPLKKMSFSYLCSETSSHPAIKVEYLEEYIAQQCAAAIHSGAEVKQGDRQAVLNAVGELQRIEREASYVRADRKADRITRSQEIKDLDTLATERRAAEQALANLRASNAAADIFAEVVRHIDPTTHRVDLALEAQERTRITSQILGLDLDRRRDLVRALLTFTLNKGRDTQKRVSVTHKLAVELNEEADPYEGL